MKSIKQILLFVGAICALAACDNGIDSITKLDPGPDEDAPQVTINYPSEGTKIKVLEAVTSVTVDFEVTDDIEVVRVELWLDGQKIATFSNFKDFRRVLIDDFVYDALTDGSHELKVLATDLDGKTTTQSVNFEKEPAYTPLFAGETLYMPFDGDFTDLIRISQATVTGAPGFAGDGIIGTNAYQGATDAYVSVPGEGVLLGNEFSAAFWYKVSGSPDRAGILVAGDDADDRFQGFRLFREGSPTEQRIKLNVGVGTGESWNDGEVLDVAAGEWVHIAFTISPTRNAIFFNGVEVRSSDMPANVDWTGVNSITIGAGGDTFSYWGHLSDNSPLDELRFFDRALTEADIQNMIDVTNPYTGKFDGEMFYLPFDGDNRDKFTNAEPTVVGATGFAGESASGSNAFAGAAGSYLSFPTDGLTTQEFSATFWYKVNANPDRAGILVMGPPHTDNPGYPDVQNLRTNGFRFFREGDASSQIFKLNVGNGTADSWFDGGDNARIDTSAGEWVHMAFTISNTECVVYFNGEIVAQGSFTGVDWTGCDILSIGSGAPRFTEWGHLSDPSFIDELRLFDKALTQEEIQAVRNADL